MDKILLPLVCLFAAKVVIYGTRYPEAIALLIFAAFVLIKEHYDTHKVVKEYKKLLEQSNLDANRTLEDMRRELDNIKTSIASVKIAQSMRGINGKS